MAEKLPQEILDSADITAITQLILRERESRDLGRWKRMGECFWPDSLVRVSWFRGSGAEFVAGSMDMAKRGVLAKHRLGPILVNLAGDRALASMSAIIDLPVKLYGVELTLSAHARFLYCAERRGGRWGLHSFDAIYMRDELTPSIPGQSVTIDPQQVKDFRPSYRMLTYYLKTQGYEIDANLAGEDQPATVEKLNSELYAWAGVKL